MSEAQDSLAKEVEKRGWVLTHFEEGKKLLEDQLKVGREIARSSHFIARRTDSQGATGSEIAAETPEALVASIDAHPLTVAAEEPVEEATPEDVVEDTPTGETVPTVTFTAPEGETSA